MGILKGLDGWKRIIMLTLTLVQLWVLKAHGVDIGSQLGFGYHLLGWDPNSVGISAELLGTTVGSVISIGHAVVKMVREARDASNIVSLPK